MIILDKPSIEFPYEIDKSILKNIELAGRTCYKSESKITDDSADKFVKMICKNNHESVLEHFSVTARIICDRSTSHQLVRHRLASYSQESQRYINYEKRDSFKFIKPLGIGKDSHQYKIWKEALINAMDSYKHLIESGVKPETARSVLPNATKTEIVVTFNLRMWRHVIKERCLNTHAQADIRYIFTEALKYLHTNIPVVFDDLWEQFELQTN